MSPSPPRITFTRAQLADHLNVDSENDRDGFSTRMLTTLKRAGYSTHHQLMEALRDKRHLLTSDAASIGASTWEHFYNGYRKEMKAKPMVDRLLDILAVLLPEIAAEGLHVIADPEAFTRLPTASGDAPPGMAREIDDAFRNWLKKGRNAGPAQRLEGLYDVYFPLLQNGEWKSTIAHGRARIYRGKHTWFFESYCNITTAVQYVGRLRFTGRHSAVLVGFACEVLGQPRAPRAVSRYATEMLVHPYRLPDSPDGWWHGATTFIETSSNDYTGTIAHVMRRSDPTPPSRERWRAEISRRTSVLNKSSPDYRMVLAELRKCALRAV